MYFTEVEKLTKNLAELRQQVQSVWNNLSDVCLYTLCTSMNGRMRTLLRINVGPTVSCKHETTT